MYRFLGLLYTQPYTHNTHLPKPLGTPPEAGSVVAFNKQHGLLNQRGRVYIAASPLTSCGAIASHCDSQGLNVVTCKMGMMIVCQPHRVVVCVGCINCKLGWQPVRATCVLFIITIKVCFPLYGCIIIYSSISPSAKHKGFFPAF